MDTAATYLISTSCFNIFRWWVVISVVLLASTSINTNEVSGVYYGKMTRAPPAQASILGPVDAALALQEVIKLVAEAAGLSNQSVPVLEPCRIPDDEDCKTLAFKMLTRDRSPVPVVLLSAAGHETFPLTVQNDFSFQEIREIAPPSRRACLANRPPARSLLDLADPTIAAIYNMPYKQLQTFIEPCDEPNCQENWVPEWCTNITCATILTSRKGEADVLLKEIKENKLFAYVTPLDKNLPRATSELAAQHFIACDWAPELYLPDLVDKAKTLGTTPCLDPPCPFETRQIMMYYSMVGLAGAPSARRALQRLTISKEDMRELAKNASIYGPSEAAHAYVSAHPPNIEEEVHVAVLLPITTEREAFNTIAINAAARLAEEDIRLTKTISFKIQFRDDHCHAQEVSKLLTDAALRQDYGALSAIAGSACGAAWAETTKPSTDQKIPVLAYTLQAPVPQPKGLTDFPYQLLAAGDARGAASALSELVNKFGWRRVAALYEPATKLLLNALDKELLFSIDVPENGSKVGHKHIQDWASKASNKSARILYLCVEDTRIARAALCAARSYGLTPSAGAVWLLCNTHKPGWLEARPGEACTTEQLVEEAEGHFSVTPDWTLQWQKRATNSTEELKQWQRRWLRHCLSVDECTGAPDPYAALLYDVLLQWADSLSHLLKQKPYASEHLYHPRHAEFLIKDTIKSEYTGLTGTFKWIEEQDAYTRAVSFVISQWDSKSGAKTIGSWRNGSLVLDNAALRWYTSDGHMPDDGEEKCSIQGLANALNTDCRIAFVALCVILVAILIVIITAIAWHCKRRAEKEYRKRLQALGMRPLAIKPVALDRWEVPRERVVINRKLGTGAFGTVYGGHALLAEDQGWSAVAVKTLKAGATTEEKLDFLSEAEAMKRFDHKNVVRLLGVVTKTEPVCTVMEFMLYGDLKNYLLARRHLAMGGGIEESEGLEVDEASPKRLTGMALDVARALSYLAQLRYVHRDVAARNCLVSARRVVKIADFGMTRLVFENDYYRFSRKGMLPVRWMAPESLALGVFSPASDVWSFGVLLYEIVTFGSLPFQGLSNSEVLTKVKGGQTLDLPQGLKPQLDGLIKSCWQQDPKKRPTASEVAAFLADSPRLLTPCLDMPLDVLSLDADPPWRLPRDQAEARWVSWAAPASAGTDTTYLSTEGPVPLDTDSFLP